MWKDRGDIFPIIVRYPLEYDRRHKGGISLKEEAKRRVERKKERIIPTHHSPM